MSTGTESQAFLHTGVAAKKVRSKVTELLGCMYAHCLTAALLFSGTEWVTGASDGTLALWSQTKKRPTSILRKAHGYPTPGLQTSASQVAGADANGAAGDDPNEQEPVGPGSVGGDAASWIGSVGVCRGTDLVVSRVVW